MPAHYDQLNDSENWVKWLTVITIGPGKKECVLSALIICCSKVSDCSIRTYFDCEKIEIL